MCRSSASWSARDFLFRLRKRPTITSAFHAPSSGFGGRAARSDHQELGFLAGRAASLSTLHADVQRAVIGASTGLSRIEGLSNQVHQESSAVRIDIRREGIDRRVVCEVQGFQKVPLSGSSSGR